MQKPLTAKVAKNCREGRKEKLMVRRRQQRLADPLRDLRD
jgi:hypothetical protein